MDSRGRERRSAVAGLVATLCVGAAVLFAGPADTLGLGPSTALWWWTAYGVYLAAFVLDAEIVRERPTPATNPRLLVVELVAGAAAWLVSAGDGLTSVLFVVTAASAAFTWTTRAALLVVVGQSALLAAGTAVDGRSASEVVVTTLVNGSFQAFAVIVVSSEQRAVAARTELAATHVELRAATAQLATSARAAERLRISRDLHDLVGHQLTALALELEIASHHGDGQASEHVARARTIAKDLLRDVREAVGELRSTTKGLEPVLRELVSGLPGLAVDLSVDQRASLDEAGAVTVVRCVQVVLTNTLRHSNADRLAIAVVVDDAEMRIDARDNGQGTDHLVLGNGLNGLRERVEQLGGDLVLQTAGGRGFAVTARMPVP